MEKEEEETEIEITLKTEEIQKERLDLKQMMSALIAEEKVIGLMSVKSLRK